MKHYTITDPKPGEMVPDEIREMVEIDGLYIGCDPKLPPGHIVPLYVTKGKAYSLKIDRELGLTGFIPGCSFEGPVKPSPLIQNENKD